MNDKYDCRSDLWCNVLYSAVNQGKDINTAIAMADTAVVSYDKNFGETK